MKLSELQNKYVVSINDGKNIGTIIDINIDASNGKILSLVIEPNKSFFSFSNRGLETEIYWNDIAKIGEDVILVNSTF